MNVPSPLEDAISEVYFHYQTEVPTMGDIPISKEAKYLIRSALGKGFMPRDICEGITGWVKQAWCNNKTIEFMLSNLEKGITYKRTQPDEVAPKMMIPTVRGQEVHVIPVWPPLPNRVPPEIMNLARSVKGLHASQKSQTIDF